jgi:dsDNA-specific endonuclease/ATPase MutS2
MHGIEKIYIRKMRYNDAKIHFRNEIEKFFFRGHQYIEVIHGIGTYTLRKMVLDEVININYVQIIENNNPGSLVLELQIPDINTLKKYT